MNLFNLLRDVICDFWDYRIQITFIVLIIIFQVSKLHYLIHEFSHYGISKLLGAKYEYIQIYNCKKAKTKHILGIDVIFDANSHPKGIHAVFHWNKECASRTMLMFIPLVGTILEISIRSVLIGLVGFVASMITTGTPYLTPIFVIGYHFYYFYKTSKVDEDDFCHFLYALKQKEITD